MRNYREALCALVAVAILIGTLAYTSPARAQEIFGSVVGTVSDPGGAVLPGTTVKVTNLATGEVRSAVTDGQGNYQLLSLPVNEYKLEVDAHGFKHYSRSPIDVRVDSVVRANVAMAVGAQSENVIVTTAAPIMQTESSSLGQVVEGNAVATLPLNGRNVLALVALVPGVVPQGAASTNLSGQNVFAAGNYQIDGGNANQGSILVDGSSVNTSYGNAAELVMDQDVVQEFNVQTHNNTAEFGAYTGGVINMTTKSGTNAFHGLAFEYLRNTVLDANTFFANHTGAGRQAWHQNQFGANGGGPIKKDKIFFFADYQGYRQTNGQPILNSVPTAAELNGDFTAISAIIYDPLTTCGYNGNPACTAAQTAGTAPQRQQISYNGVPNVIPPSRMSTVAKNLLAFPVFAQPTVPGSTTATEGAANNFSKLGTAGGTNDQYTLRGDQTLSAKQTMFERYTHWASANIDPHNVFNNNLYYTSLAPEVFTTQQGVIGDTYVFNSTSIADAHLSYLRWNYNRIPTNFGLDESAKFGWPSYMNFGSLNNLSKSTAVPMMSISGPISYYEGGAGYIFSINNNYQISSTYQKVLGRHTLKTGVDLRRLEMNYFQNNNPGGIFTFDNAFTNSSPSSSAANGNGLASMELGYVSNSTSQTVQTAPPTYETQYYQGYFVMDTWQATNKITATLGIRYEVPGVFVARQGWADTFNPTETNPIVNVPGAYDLVSSQQHPAAGVRNENWGDWAPRVGVAYRLDNLTVFRAAWGRFFVPAELQFPEAPLQAGINFLNNLMVSTTNGQETPNNYVGGVYTTANTLDNPYPNGLQAPPHRNPNYQQVLLGGNPQALLANEPNGETFQWNFAIERQLPLGIALEAAYSGLKGEHLPVSLPINPLPDSVIAAAAANSTCAASYSACYLNQQVANPYYPLITQGVLKQATVTQGQLLRPFPQYGSISNSGHYIGVSNYNAMELKLQKRMPNGGMILGSYTFSKLMTDSEYLTSWLDSTGSAGYQDYNNPMSNYSLSSFDARQRLIVSYIYPIPVGRGRMFLNHMNGVGEAVIGGWGLNGITTFQEGFPLGMSVTPGNLGTYAYEGTTRPNVVPGCAKTTSGSMAKRIGGAGSTSTYFNTACFTVAPNFTFGNESRTDNKLRQPGQANWDMSLYKDLPITEKAQFEFRAEAFNVFNRVQFGPPVTTVGSSTEGWITAQYNNPRLLQISGRISF